MPPSAAARASMGERQALVMQALTGRGPVPAGFDGEAIREEARVLVSKRRRYVYRTRSALARALGRHFKRHFADYARACPRPEHVHADASQFARWVQERLGDDRMLEQIDWRVGLRSLLVGSKWAGEPRPPAETEADRKQLEILLAGARSLRGPRITEEPILRTALLLASLDVLGIEVAPPRAARLRAALEAIPAPREAETPLETAIETLQTNLALERALARHLAVEEQRKYQEYTGEDPFFGLVVPTLTMRGDDDAAAASSLAVHWASQFALSSAPATSVVGESARRLAQAVRSGDQPAGAEGRRALRIARAIDVARLQLDAELELGRHPSLNPRERESVRAMRGRMVLTVAPVADGNGEPQSRT